MKANGDFGACLFELSSLFAEGVQKQGWRERGLSTQHLRGRVTDGVAGVPQVGDAPRFPAGEHLRHQINQSIGSSIVGNGEMEDVLSTIWH